MKKRVSLAEQQELAELERLFFAALQRPRAERAAFLARTCGGDRKLHAKVERLLQADSTPRESIDTGPWSASRSPIEDIAGQRFGAYELVDFIGAGGMGTVWRAKRVDAAFNRHVAIKLLKRGLDSDELVSRFRQEREVLARLEHANVARLYDGGATNEGRPYLVMEYIQGDPIDAYCAQKHLRLDAILRLFRQVCLAVQFAHANLVVHRDLKPSNILITEQAEPKLLDFGIAKLLLADDEQTAFSAPLFTRRYASPEQLAHGPITTATDVFSLGLVLYESLTGVQPDRTANEELPLPSEATRCRMQQDCGGPNVAPEALRGDLDEILRKALRTDPRERYGSAGDLAEDLARFLRHDPIAARPDTLTYRTRKFARRNPALIGSAAVVLLITLIGLSASMTFYFGAENARRIAVIEQDTAEWNSYMACIAAADGALRSSYFPRKAHQHLSDAPDRFRAWEWQFLSSRIDRTLISASSGTATDRKILVAWQPAGTHLASVEGSGNLLRIYDGRTGRAVQDLGRLTHGKYRSISFSNDGSLFAAVVSDGIIRMWMVGDDEFQPFFDQQLAFPAQRLSFHPGGTDVSIACEDGSVRGFRIASHGLSNTWTFVGPHGADLVTSNITASQRLVVGYENKIVMLDAANGCSLAERDVQGKPDALRIAPNGNVMAVFANSVLTLAPDDLKETNRTTIRSATDLRQVKFDPTSRHIAFRRNRTHHLARGELTSAHVVSEYHGSREYGILKDHAFSDDGERVAVASWERTLEIWDVSGTPNERHLRHWPDAPSDFLSIDAVPDGSLIVTGSSVGVTLWDADTAIPLRRFSNDGVNDGRSHCVRFRPQGDLVVSSHGNHLNTWCTKTGQLLWQRSGTSRRPNTVATSPDGQYIAIVREHQDGAAVELCDWTTGAVIRVFATPIYGARCIAFSPNGRYIACGTGRGEGEVFDARVVVWDVTTGQTTHNFSGFKKVVEDVAWSRDGQTIAACGHRREVCFWSLETGDQLPSAVFGTGVYRCFDLCFSPDGMRLVVANSSGTVRFWDLEHSQEVFDLGFISGCREVVFAADQRWLAGAGRWATTIWDTASPAERVVPETIRRRHVESPASDWSNVLDLIQADVWLNPAQKTQARRIINRAREYSEK